MSSEILVTFVGVNNSQGLDLAKRVEQIVKNEFKYNFYLLLEPTITENTYALLNSDVLIIDGSIEQGHNYDNATLGPLVLDYVWLVSRTHLPTNYQGIVEGGYPKYDPNKPTIFSNLQILSWIRNALSANKRFLPRQGKGSFIRYFRDIASVTDAIAEARKNKYNVFISYRSKNIKKAEKVKDKIEKGKLHNGTPKKVYLIQPGELVFRDELLTEYKRWQIQCLVRDYIEACEEFWIIQDDKDDYFQSWWTQGELVSLAYREQVRKIRVYSIEDKEVIPTPERYKIYLSESQKDRLGRWYANTDPVLMNAGSRHAMKMWKNVPLIGKHSYFSDHVWSDEFWEYPAFNCSTCAKRLDRVSKLNVEYFMWLNQHKDLVFLSPYEADIAKKSKKVSCPRCGTTLRISEEKARHIVYYDKNLRDVTDIPSSLIEEKIYRIK